MHEVIRIENLTRFYTIGEETVRALNGINLSIKKNEYVALMGPSGSGKSTLMNIIGCLDTPTSGEYFLNGPNVAQLSDSELAAIRNKEIGFVFQTFNLLPRLTALQNVALPLVYAGIPEAERLKKAKEVLEQVGLGDRIKHRPNELSGGQRQRLGIARALYHQPDVLIFDEATSALDGMTEDAVMQAVQKLSQQCTMVLIAHRLRTIQACDRIVMLDGGVVVADGGYEHLMQTAPAFRRLAGVDPNES